MPTHTFRSICFVAMPCRHIDVASLIPWRPLCDFGGVQRGSALFCSHTNQIIMIVGTGLCQVCCEMVVVTRLRRDRRRMRRKQMPSTSASRCTMPELINRRVWLRWRAHMKTIQWDVVSGCVHTALGCEMRVSSLVWRFNCLPRVA